MKAPWPDLMDMGAGPVATGDRTIQQVGEALFDEIVAVASGQKHPWAEKHRLQNYLCIFNPAPIT